MNFDIERLLAERESERYALHTRYLNEQLIRVLKTIGFDRAYQRGVGQYLYDREGQKYLDLLSGFGMFALGRNHPVVRETLKKILDSDLILCKCTYRHLPEFWQYVPHLDKAFFANSGSEAVEAAIKIVRAATTRSGIVYCSHAFTALPMGRCLSMVTRFSVPALEVMEAEGLTQNAARLGARLLATFQGMVKRHELVKSARGKCLMIGVEFGAPRSLKLKASWNLLETANSGLFCQLIVIPLLKEQRILSQVAGHGNHTIKLLPPLIITETDCDWIEQSFEAVIADAHRVPGAIWSLGKTLLANVARACATA